jgi:hypothetical protein
MDREAIMNILEILGILAVVCLLPQIIRLVWFLMGLLFSVLAYSVIGIITGVCLLVGAIFTIPVYVFALLDRGFASIGPLTSDWIYRQYLWILAAVSLACVFAAFWPSIYKSNFAVQPTAAATSYVSPAIKFNRTKDVPLDLREEWIKGWLSKDPSGIERANTAWDKAHPLPDLKYSD